VSACPYLLTVIVCEYVTLCDIVVTSPNPGQQTGRTIMLGTGRNTSGTAATSGQKFVILQSRSQTPTVSNINTSAIQQTQQPQQSQTQQQQPQQQQQAQQQQQQQQVKLAQTSVGQQKTHIQGSTPKLVVVCMPTSSHTNTSITQVRFLTFYIIVYECY